MHTHTYLNLVTPHKISPHGTTRGLTHGTKEVLPHGTKEVSPHGTKEDSPQGNKEASPHGEGRGEEVRLHHMEQRGSTTWEQKGPHSHQVAVVRIL